MTSKKSEIESGTVEVMRRLLAMPPKPHEEMKVGRAAPKKKRGSKGRASSAKRRNAG